MPCDARGRLVDGLAGIDSFELVACDTRSALLLGPGNEKVSRKEAGRLVYPFFRKGLIEQEGVQSIRPGGCGDRSSQHTGLVITVDLCDTDIALIAHHLHERARAGRFEDKRLAFIIESSARTGPRCVAGDAGCRPIPARSGPRASYQRDADRLLADELRGGACGHDGDCLTWGWSGELCVNWTEPLYETLGGTLLDDAFCGCVGGRCSWFTQ